MSYAPVGSLLTRQGFQKLIFRWLFNYSGERKCSTVYFILYGVPNNLSQALSFVSHV